MIFLFSYGTLQQREVQLATYGRVLSGTQDMLAGHVLAPLAISDDQVIKISGKAVHTIARATGNPPIAFPASCSSSARPSWLRPMPTRSMPTPALRRSWNPAGRLGSMSARRWAECEEPKRAPVTGRPSSSTRALA